jgi:hypothetical protein
MLWRNLAAFAAFTLLAALPGLPAAAQTGSPDEVAGELIFSISPDEMQQLLNQGGFAVLQKPHPLRWIVRSPSGYTMMLDFAVCPEYRCRGVRLRASWPLGQRPKALAAVRSYEQSVAIAHVNLMTNQSGSYVLVGRDIWMFPGRTAANVAAQLQHTDILAGSMTQHLREQDPGISELWEQKGGQ